MDNVLFAFALTLFAGLSTGIGSLISFFSKTTNKKFLSFSLGFSAGVMIYVSMIEIFQKANTALVNHMGLKKGSFPEAERAADEVLSLPMYPELEESSVEKIAEKIAGV